MQCDPLSTSSLLFLEGVIKVLQNFHSVVVKHSGQDQNKCSGLRGCHWNQCAAMLGQLILLNTHFSVSKSKYKLFRMWKWVIFQLGKSSLTCQAFHSL